MSKANELKKLQEKVVSFRDQKVLLDSDLAKMLGTTTSSLMQTVTKFSTRFPETFVFTSKKKEITALIEMKHVTKKQMSKRTKPPLFFTEPGAYMATFLLKTPAAEQLSVAVLETFLTNEKKK